MRQALRFLAVRCTKLRCKHSERLAFVRTKPGQDEAHLLKYSAAHSTASIGCSFIAKPGSGRRGRDQVLSHLLAPALVHLPQTAILVRRRLRTRAAAAARKIATAAVPAPVAASLQWKLRLVFWIGAVCALKVWIAWS